MFKKREKGQSAVEFALVVAMAIIMFLGMMQFGMYLYGLSIVENAARQGARLGSVSQSCPSCEASSGARSALAGQPVIRDASVTILAPGGVVGSTVKIRVTAHVPMIVPGGATFGLGSLTTVSAEATFRQEGWRP
jgi:Flp pilus assembly protein TadG